MKVNLFLTVLALFISGIFGWFAYSISDQQDYDIFCGICSGVTSLVTLLPLMGFHYESNPKGINIRVLCLLFWLILFILNIYYSYTEVIMPYYVMLNGVIMIIFLAILYKLIKLKDI